jgi:hypothetical protein
MTSLVPQPEDLPVSLGPPRFTLRTLLLAVTLAGCLFGVMQALGTLWSMGMLMILCLVFAHVAGNSLGTSLRDHATRQAAAERSDTLADHRPPTKLDVTIPHQLTQRARLNRVTLVMAGGGAIAGGALGATVSAFVYPEAGVAAVGLGLVSAAVLGALVGFAASSFVSVARAALGEALGNGDPAVSRFSNRPPQ